jgi:LacI family transcriptional regulator
MMYVYISFDEEVDRQRKLGIMAVTLRDVARAVGVSPIAVSKVLHDKGGNVRVSTAKAEIIRRVAAEMNYTPNNLARSLRGGKTKTIGLMFDQFGPIGTGSRYMGLLLDGITRAAFEQGYSLTICPHLSHSAAGFIGDGRFDGVVYAKSNVDEEAVQAAQRSKVKIVHIHVPPSLANLKGGDYVCCDNVQAMTLALQHLKDLGHKRVALINERENLNALETAYRAEQFAVVAQDLGFDPTFTKVGSVSLDGTEAESWLRNNRDVTALILRTESLATQIYAAADKLGLCIPQDLSIIGFDSTEYCNSLTPKLTAIAQPIREMAEEAVRMLIEVIEEKAESGRMRIHPVQIDIRESTAAPRKG